MSYGGGHLGFLNYTKKLNICKNLSNDSMYSMGWIKFLVSDKNYFLVFIFSLQTMLKLCLAVVTILDLLSAQNTDARYRQSKEHSHQVCMQMVQYFQRVMQCNFEIFFQCPILNLSCCHSHFEFTIHTKNETFLQVNVHWHFVVNRVCMVVSDKRKKKFFILPYGSM